MRIFLASLSTYSSEYNRGKLVSLAKRVDHLTVATGKVPTIWGEVHAGVFQDSYDLHILPTHVPFGWASRTLRGLSTVVSDARPDLLHVEAEPWQAITAQAVLIARKAGIPVGVQFAETGPRLRAASGAFRRVAARRVLSYCDYAIGWAQASAELASSLAPGLRVLAMPGTGIDAAEICTDLTAERVRWFGEPSSCGICFVGRLTPEKGVDDFMAACDVIREHVEIRVAIVGDGPLRETVERWASERSWVVTHGMVSRFDAVRCMASAALILIPSRTIGKHQEQFGKAAIEAMAVGTPVVSYACGALPEVIGIGGTVVAEGDVRALASTAQHHLLLSPLGRGEASDRARRQAAGFGSDGLAERLVELWAEILIRATYG